MNRFGYKLHCSSTLKFWLCLVSIVHYKWKPKLLLSLPIFKKRLCTSLLQINYIAVHAEHSYWFCILSNQNSSIRKHSEVAQKLAFPIIRAERFLRASCQAPFAKALGTLTKGEFPNLCYNTESSSNILIRQWSLLGSSIIKHCYAQQDCSSVWLGSLQWALFL